MAFESAPATERSTTERLEARVTPRQKALFREAAEMQGVTLTDFIVSSVHHAAMRALEARHVLALSRKDQQAFVRALGRPSAPNARLRAAWRKHASRSGGRAPKARPAASTTRARRRRG